MNRDIKRVILFNPILSLLMPRSCSPNSITLQVINKAVQRGASPPIPLFLRSTSVGQCASKEVAMTPEKLHKALDIRVPISLPPEGRPRAVSSDAFLSCPTQAFTEFGWVISAWPLFSFCPLTRLSFWDRVVLGSW